VSFLSKAIHGVGSVLGKVGDVAKVASPLVSFIPGVGPLLAAGIGAGAGALSKLNDKHVTLGNTLGSVAGGAAIGGLGGLGIDKLQGLAGANGGGIGGAVSGVGKLLGGTHAPGAVSAAGQAAGGGAGGIGGLLGGVLNTAKANPALVLGGLAALQGTRQAGQASDLRNQGVNLAMADYNSRLPFQQAALERLKTLGTTPAGVGALAIPNDASNPYNRPRSSAVPGIGRM
jgi:hypothetical protein